MPRLLPCLLAALALVLGACGSDDEPASTTAAGTTATAAETTPAPPTEVSSGCRVEQPPTPKEVEDRKRPTLKLKRGTTYTAALETSCGSFEIRLASGRAPKTSAAFVALSRDGFFDGLTFHRIVPGFVIQGGDPAGTGEGGPGFEVVEAPPKDLKYERGVVAMAKTELDDPGTSGSQFFVVTGEDAGLPADYALLGRVTKGLDVVEKIAGVPTDPATQQPESPVVIEQVTIRES